MAWGDDDEIVAVAEAPAARAWGADDEVVAAPTADASTTWGKDDEVLQEKEKKRPVNEPPELRQAEKQPKTLSDLMSGRFGRDVKIPKNIKVPTMAETGAVPAAAFEGLLKYTTPAGLAVAAAETVAPEATATKVGQGVLTGAGEALASFTTPENLAGLAVMPQSKLAQVLINLGFGAEAATHLPEQIKAYGATNDPQEKAKIATGIAVSLGLPTALTAHAGYKAGRASASEPRKSAEPLKSFDQLPDDLVAPPPAPETAAATPAIPFLEDPAIPFMTKVRLKEEALEFGLTEQQIAPMTGVEISQLAESRRASAGASMEGGGQKSDQTARDAEYDRMAAKLEELNKDQFLPDRETVSESDIPSAQGEPRPLQSTQPLPERPGIIRPASAESVAQDLPEVPGQASRSSSRVKRSAEEIAAEEEYRRDLQSEANAAQAGQGPELRDAIMDAGGLPGKEAPTRKAFAGEIKRIEEIVRDPARADKVVLNKLFRNNAPELDELATRLRDRGFDVQTPGDLLNLIEQRERTGKPIYGTPEREMAGAESYASLAQATLPRRIQSPALASPAAPRSLADIRKYLSTALDIPIRMGTRVGGGVRGALGLYRVKPQTIRMQALNDIPTIAHEVGHDLHHIVFTDPKTGGPSNFLWGFDGELKPLGRRTAPPNARPELVRMEGVAEYVREYLTDRARAIAAAPNFTAYFETTLRTKHPEIHQVLTNARDQLQAYIAAPGWEKAKSAIQWKETDIRKPWRERLENFYTSWFNELRPIDRAMGKLVELGLDPAVAGEVSARAINYRGGWRGKADHDLRFELTDLDGKARGKSLHEIVGGIADRQDFETYITLKRAQEKAGQGKTTGFEDALADPDTHRKLRDMAPHYEARRQDLIKYSEGLLQNMEQSGFFTADQLAAMRSANRDYVPFYRIYEAVTGETTGPRGGGDGLVNTSSGVMRFKGSDLQIASPLESIIKNTYMFRDLAERNRIARQFVDAVEATTGGGRVAESLLKPMKPTQITHEEMAAKLHDLGLGPEAEKLTKAGVNLAHTIFRAANGISAKDGTFAVWKDGKQKLYQVGDEALLRSLTLADSTDAMLISKMPGFKPAAWITDKLRTGATLSAEFIARNLMRDQITAAVYSRHGFVPLFDSARGVFSVFKKDQWYRDWMKSGASHSGMFDSSARNVEQALREVIKEPTALGQALELINPLNIIQNLRRASSMIEESTRVAEYRLARGRGRSELEAANDAKDVTLNFSRHGAKGKVVNQLIAFFNAGLQDLDKIRRAHMEAPVRTATKAFLYITVPSITAWFLGKDDERIQTLPEWRKTLFWNLNLGDPSDPDGFVLSVPKPFLIGSIYGTAAEKALDVIYGKDPNAVWKMFGALAHLSIPGGGMPMLPTAFKPVIENITNYSFFTGRPIVSQSQRHLETGLQFNPQTSEVAKFVGPKVGLAPVMVDNLVRGYLGGLGMTGLDAIDWFIVKTGLATPGTAPAKSWRELPGMRAFFQSPYAPNEYVSRFYKAMDVAEGRLKTFAAYGNRMMAGEQKRYWEENRNPLVWYKAQAGDAEMITQLRRIRDLMGDIGKSMVMIQNDRTIDAQTKRERLINLKDARDKLARQAFDAYVHPDDRRKVF